MQRGQILLHLSWSDFEALVDTAREYIVKDFAEYAEDFVKFGNLPPPKRTARKPTAGN